MNRGILQGGIGLTKGGVGGSAGSETFIGSLAIGYESDSAHPRPATGVMKDGFNSCRFHRDGSAFGRAELRAARRGSVARRRGLGVGYARQPLSRLPLRLFGGQPGPLPSEDPGRHGGAGGSADVDLPRLPQRSTGFLLRRDRGTDRLP